MEMVNGIKWHRSSAVVESGNVAYGLSGHTLLPKVDIEIEPERD